MPTFPLKTCKGWVVVGEFTEPFLPPVVEIENLGSNKAASE